jgi:transposase
MVLVIAFLWVLKAQTDAAGAMTDGGILSVGASLG